MRRQQGVVDKPTSLPMSATDRVQSSCRILQNLDVHLIEHGLSRFQTGLAGLWRSVGTFFHLPVRWLGIAGVLFRQDRCRHCYFLMITHILAHPYRREWRPNMPRITYLTPHFAVTGALQPDDFAAVAALGFKSVLSNLPDGEASSSLLRRRGSTWPQGAGLRFRHVPAIKSEVFSDRVVDGMQQALQASWRVPCWLIAHPVCAPPSPGRLLRLAASPLTVSSQTLKKAGFDLAAVRDELEDQGGRTHAAHSSGARLRCARKAVVQPRGRGIDGLRAGRRQSMLWVPSQNGLSSVPLHPHRLKVPELSATKRWGWKLVVLWEPSQKGCLAERPQVHQK